MGAPQSRSCRAKPNVLAAGGSRTRFNQPTQQGYATFQLGRGTMLVPDRNDRVISPLEMSV